MKKNLLLFLIANWQLSFINSFAQPFTATYNFADVTNSTGTSDPTALPAVTGIIFGPFESNNVSANSGASGRFSFTQWPAGATTADDNYASLTGSLDDTKYYGVYFYPEVGYSIDLTSITFSVQRSGTGIRTYSVRSDADNYAANLPASINPTNTNLSVQSGNIFFWNADATTSNQNGSTITLSGAEFTASTIGFAFRFYGWNAEGTVGTFSIDNVTFTGSVTQVPVSINGSLAETSMNIFPNPSANGIFTLELSDNIQGTTNIQVMNMLGETIASKQITVSQTKIDLSGFAAGSYLVRVSSEDGVVTRKISF